LESAQQFALHYVLSSERRAVATVLGIWQLPQGVPRQAAMGALIARRNN
jgi:hypothetical protein